MENMEDKLNLVVDYIEEHLTEELDQEKIAQIAGFSYFDVGRIFSLIAGIGISDYIRKRRMTLAGRDLKFQNAKVIDVALKYGYDSPVSFARAFRAFHGINPNNAGKRNATIKVFRRLLFNCQAVEEMGMLGQEIVCINEKEYKATYFGKQSMSDWSDYATMREFWRLEDVGNDFDNCERLPEVLPYNNYPPIKIEVGQVFLIEYHMRTGTVERKFYIADGTVWRDMPSTRAIAVE